MKRTFIFFSVLCAIFIINLSFPGSVKSANNNDELYLKISKSFDLYGTAFRELLDNYVIKLDPDELVQNAIMGMISNLDPYTVYLKDDDVEDINTLSTGSYTGIGIVVSQRDSILTIISVRNGSAAEKAGIKIGDRIFSINDTVFFGKNNDDLKKFTRGTPGTSFDIVVIRGEGLDTLKKTVFREDVKIDDISYSDFISDSTAYLKIDQFSKTTGEELRTALYDLNNIKPVKSIIIDLRDNPGGLLESAIACVEAFVPKGSLIVTTKGQYADYTRPYYSIIPPMDTTVKIAVLINRFSASASEVFAGAIQDLDRGVIIGERSFGKGLVQSVFDLPYNRSIKITTAKYYSPSGRCINRIMNSKNSDDLLASHTQDSVYYTRNKRPVNESNGILPDSLIKEDTVSDYLSELLKNDIIFKFANYFSAKHEKDYNLNSFTDLNKSNDLVEDDVILNEFEDYLHSIKFEYKTALEKQLDLLNKMASKDNLSSKTLKELNSLSSKIKKEFKNPVLENSERLLKLIKFEIFARFNSYKAIIKSSLIDDRCINTAQEILNSTVLKALIDKR